MLSLKRGKHTITHPIYDTQSHFDGKAVDKVLSYVRDTYNIILLLMCRPSLYKYVFNRRLSGRWPNKINLNKLLFESSIEAAAAGGALWANRNSPTTLYHRRRQFYGKYADVWFRKVTKALWIYKEIIERRGRTTSLTFRRNFAEILEKSSNSGQIAAFWERSY